MSLPQIAGLELQELIGRGSCGAVYRATAGATGETCAVKVFNSMSINRKMLSIALRGLQTMPAHPGIIPILAYEFDQSPYFSAMPLLGNAAESGKGKKNWEVPTLELFCGTVAAEEAWRYIYEVCDAMAWLHKHNLAHCNLKPRNVLVSDDPSSATKLGDIVQGWISGLHHFDPTDHFMYLPPEQAEHPEALATQGTTWDVYSFGVVAYRLLTGEFPRAGDLYTAQLQQQNDATGVVVSLDNRAIFAAVKAQPEIVWPTAPTSKWDARRKEIIQKCLALDLKDRWPDLREVMREFEKLEADYLLEDAREKIEQEKRQQSRKVILLRSAAMVLGTALVVAVGYGAYFGWSTWNRVQKAETIIVEKDNQLQAEVTTHKDTVDELAQRLDQAQEAQRQADANLQTSQEAVDQFLTQILQMPTGLGLQAEFSDKQINDALSFYEKDRLRLMKDEALLPELARNYFNTAQLLLRKQKRTDAQEYFAKAQKALLSLLEKTPEHVDTLRRKALLGRTNRWLGTLKVDESRPSEARQFFKDAVVALTPALESEPENRGIRFETATAWYELGKRSRRDGFAQESVDALAKVSTLLDPKTIGEALQPQEQFIIAKSQIEQALSLRDQGKVDEAMKSLFDSMEVMVKLVERSAPHNQEQALTLAEAYLEFGEIVAEKLGTTDAKDAQNEAQAILMELVRVHPQWADARHLLARNYGDMANLERDLGNGSEAIRKQTMSVKTLDELSKDNPDNTRFLMELAKQQGQQAQLLTDLSKSKEALPVAEAAITKLTPLLSKNADALDVIDRKNGGILLAQLYGILGVSAEISKDSTLAKTSLAKAAELWGNLKTQYADNEVIAQGATWSAERLKKMK